MRDIDIISEMMENICDDLDITPPRVKIVGEVVLGSKIGACSTDGSELLLKKGLQVIDYFVAIAHECRHLWQFKTGKHNPPKTKDSYIDSAKGLEEYSMQECELDANAYAQYIIKRDYGITLDFGYLPEKAKIEIKRRADEGIDY